MAIPDSDVLTKLLNAPALRLTARFHTTAYNTLVDYLESPEWFDSREGRLLIEQSVEVLRSILGSEES